MERRGQRESKNGPMNPTMGDEACPNAERLTTAQELYAPSKLIEELNVSEPDFPRATAHLGGIPSSRLTSGLRVNGIDV